VLRWRDNDAYGHVNNVVYYEWFDAAVNAWLIEATGAGIGTLPAIGIVAATSCRYIRELSFPGEVSIGLGVVRVGNSSVTYRLGVFAVTPDCAVEQDPRAVGSFVHVYIDASSRRPVPIPAQVRSATTALAPSAGPLESA
jgi:acyl-CoA thioester hydrolase